MEVSNTPLTFTLQALECFRKQPIETADQVSDMNFRFSLKISLCFLESTTQYTFCLLFEWNLLAYFKGTEQWLLWFLSIWISLLLQPIQVRYCLSFSVLCVEIRDENKSLCLASKVMSGMRIHLAWQHKTKVTTTTTKTSSILHTKSSKFAFIETLSR